MAAICIICKNLDRFGFYIDGKKIEACQCLAKKYMQDNIPGYYSLNLILKQAKVIKDIQEKCDSWDDALAAKNPQQ